jgi:hypothetical protein
MKFGQENEGRDHLGDSEVDRRIILRYMCEKLCEGGEWIELAQNMIH